MSKGGQLQLAGTICGPAAEPFEAQPELWPLRLAASRIDRCEETTLGLIEEGQIRYAFNFAMPGASRREVRVWAPSVEDLIDGDEERLKREDTDAELMAVISEIMPRPAGSFTASELATRLHVSKELVLRLLNHKGTELTRCLQRAATSSPWVDRMSAISFLAKRRIT